MSKTSSILPIEHIEQAIYMIRGQKVMLDRDLAVLYGVSTSRLNEQVRRNSERFPDDFMFQLTNDEFENWKSQFATSNPDSLRYRNGTLEPLRSQNATLKNSSRGKHTKYLPYAFTEQGIAMLSGVLRSPRAVTVNIEIMRAFVRFRHILTSQKELEKIVAELRSFVLKKSTKTDHEVRKIWQAIEKLSQPADGGKIGFSLN